MRILEVSEHYFPHVGGISEHVYSLSRELMKRGHRVDVLTSRLPGWSPNGVPVVRLGTSVPLPINKSFSRMTLGVGLWSSINQVLRRNHYDVIHVHGSLAPMLPLACLHYSRNQKGRTVAVGTFHAGHDPSSLYRIFKHPLRRQFFVQYDGLIAVSQIAQETMSHFFPGDYKIIPNGVDTGVFSPGNCSLDLPQSSLKLLFMGRFDAKKGLRYLLRAMPIIQNRIPDVKLVVCGGGPLPFGFNDLLRSRTGDAVHFAGEIKGNERAEYYRWCDLSITPSIGAESFGLTVLEAMSCGKPVVATDLPAFRQVMDSNHGIFVKPRDHLDIAGGIIELAGRRSQWKALGQAGRKEALTLDWSEVVVKVEEYFNEVRRRNGVR